MLPENRGRIFEQRRNLSEDPSSKEITDCHSLLLRRGIGVGVRGVTGSDVIVTQ